VAILSDPPKPGKREMSGQISEGADPLDVTVVDYRPGPNLRTQLVEAIESAAEDHCPDRQWRYLT
jgi:hypothetical protein